MPGPNLVAPADDRAAELAGQVSPGRWVIVVLLTAAFYALDWLRYWCLFRLLGHPFPLSLGIKLVGISYFVSSLTPSSELHLPVMVIILVVHGYPLADATALIVAADKGFCAQEGLDVELIREVSWSNIRDKLNIGLFDAALEAGEPAYLWVAEDNPRAHAFYRRNGFVADGARKVAEQWEDLTEIRMVR